MPDSKALTYLKQKLRRRGLRFKTLEELATCGVLVTPPTKGLYDVPSRQYEPPKAADHHAMSGYALWYDHMRRDRTWAIGFMKHLPDSLDWQFAGTSEGKRKVGKIDNVRTLTARYVYATLGTKVAITWIVTPANDEHDLVGIRVTFANSRTESRWCSPTDVVQTILAFMVAEYDLTEPDHPRRSWLR